MTLQSSTIESGSATAAQARSLQFVAFVIDGQHYCTDIMAVREIQNWNGVTPLPNTAIYMLGVINLRGVIVPIIDLKARLGLGSSTPGPTHVVVVVSLGGKLHGLLVDGVSDIVSCKAAEVAEIPETLGQLHNPFLSGLVTKDDSMMAVVALERLIAPAGEPAIAASAAA
jgi:purine-binding chemotaxis protein CheW